MQNIRFVPVLTLFLALSTSPAFAHESRVPEPSTEQTLSECAFVLSDNPFATFTNGPFPYDELKAEHFEPAFRHGIEEVRRRLRALRDDKSRPTFKNTVLALENLFEPVDRVMSILYNYTSMNTTDELDALSIRLSSELGALAVDVHTDADLHARVKELSEKADRLRLDDEEKTLLTNTLKQFTVLPPEKMPRLKEINARLAVLTKNFRSNVSGAVDSYRLFITDQTQLEGLPPILMDIAADQAATAGHPGEWLITLQAPSYVPVMAFLKNRAVREKLWRAFQEVGSLEGFDNHQNLLEIVKLRHERAQLLGYKTHADLQLEDRMAKNIQTVDAFLNRLSKAYLEPAKKEMAELEQLAGHKIEPWDINYYIEQYKKQKLGFDVEAMRPYFKFENVLKGAFYAAHRLYGVTFKDRPDIPTWHPSVKAFELLDRTGRHLAYFYFDPNPRVGKRTGAWNSDLISGGLLNGKVERPQVVNVTNFTPSTETAPSLLSLGEVTTLFHEMGHALHNMLSQAHYRSLFGTNVPWDFVELPSQLFENWALVPEVLDQYAHHYQTGERIPAVLIEKAQKAANVGAAYSGVRQLFLASLDLSWYSQDIGDQTVEQFEDGIRARFPILDGKGYSTSTSFSHIFAGGYSAGYYSYKWSEVLDADALEAFTENGMFDPHTAFLYQLHILEKGGSEAPDVLYRRFRGRDADPDAILRREGLAPAKPTEPTQLELPF